MAAIVLPFNRSAVRPRPERPYEAKLHALRQAIWITPFLVDGDTRERFLQLVEEIAADLDSPRPAAEKAV